MMAKRGSKQATAGQAVAMPFDADGGIDAQLRRAIEDSGLSRYAIAQQSGISQSILSRFVNGERGLTAETAERLAVALGWRMALVSGSDGHMLAALFDGITGGRETPPPLPRELVLRAVRELAEASSLRPYVAIADVRTRLADGDWLWEQGFHKQPPSRAVVDDAIKQQRKLGAVSLSVAEFRHEMTAAERDACFADDGKLYMLLMLTGSKS
jgi:transcriptional regulator with XRE-family HTH domain